MKVRYQHSFLCSGKYNNITGGLRKMRPEWNNFVPGKWENEVNVRDFIQRNYHPYDGDESFLAEATQDTKDLWQIVLDLQKKEREAGGVLATK